MVCKYLLCSSQTIQSYTGLGLLQLNLNKTHVGDIPIVIGRCHHSFVRKVSVVVLFRMCEPGKFYDLHCRKTCSGIRLTCLSHVVKLFFNLCTYMLYTSVLVKSTTSWAKKNYYNHSNNRRKACLKRITYSIKFD